ncbi:uncharacterized protein Smp_203160 [Schistosoma mansoni]|uniref:uncharacterized protein n=1 Tax=Schistosoma mansoni TaxID=6183 RepID=UPI00022DBF37|nr:uncharacterized protein Smp_203160 [Schistosoma mansoni]|eukprot:XP_018653152.1 uncharacterized protein Smp_203160 [Schistosoma mansoni]
MNKLRIIKTDYHFIDSINNIKLFIIKLPNIFSNIHRNIQNNIHPSAHSLTHPFIHTSIHPSIHKHTIIKHIHIEYLKQSPSTIIAVLITNNSPRM